MELEGLEPSSKRGTNELSTCLFLSWFSSRGRLRTANRDLILCCFGLFARLSEPYSRFSCTALSISLGKRTIGRCLVSATVAEIKRHLLYFDYAARAYCFSPFEIVMSQIKERSHHCSACLHTTSTRCQNRSAPVLLQPAGGGAGRECDVRRGGYSLSNMQVAARCAKIGIVFGLSKLSLGRGSCAD